MSSSQGACAGTTDPDVEFTGKYESSGLVGAWLLDRFYLAVRDLLMSKVDAGSTLMEIGCGAGYSSQRIASWLPAEVHYIASDIGASLIGKSALRNPGLPLVRQSAYQLALPDKSVDVIVMLEVLEHLDDPDAALMELQRVAKSAVVISTPREPLWRALNLVRGKYIGALGNTPGHVQHWSFAGLQRQASRYFTVVESRRPIPWTVLLLAPRP